MSALSERLNEARGTESQRSVAKRAASKFPVGESTLFPYFRVDHPRPTPEVLSALSWALKVPEADLAELAGVKTDGAAWEPPKEASYLTERQRRAIDEVIRAIVPAPTLRDVPAEVTFEDFGVTTFEEAADPAALNRAVRVALARQARTIREQQDELDALRALAAEPARAEPEMTPDEYLASLAPTQSDYELAANRMGESEEERRRRLEAPAGEESQVVETDDGA